MDRNIISAVNISSFCRICTTNNDVEWSIYETLNEDEGATNLHTMLVKLYPTVFNESQMLCDEALKWPMKICKECKTKVIESYRFYERCTKSARSLRTIALKEQSTTETSQEEKDDHPAVIKTEFIEFEEATVLKEEYDSDDYSSACNGFHEGSSKDDVFSDTEDSLPAPTSSRNSSASVDKRQQKQCNKNKAKSRDAQRRNITSDTDRAKIIFAFEKGVTGTEIAKSMQLNLSTVFGVIARYRKTGDIKAKKRGGIKPKMLSETQISRIRALRKENSSCSLKQIQQKLSEEFGILVSTTTVARQLEKVVKKVVPADDVFSSEEFFKTFNS